MKHTTARTLASLLAFLAFLLAFLSWLSMPAVAQEKSGGEQAAGQTGQDEKAQEKKKTQKKKKQKKTTNQLKVLWKTPLGSTSFGSAAVADVNLDGFLDVAFGTYFGDSRVVVLSGRDGKKIWDKNFGTACLDASPRFCDVNQDGKLDLVIPVSNLCQVVAFDAATGKEIWTYRIATRGECIDSPPAIVDTDGNGTLEVVFGTFNARLHVVDGKTGKRLRTVPVGKRFVQTGPNVLDLDGDGTKDFVAGIFNDDRRLYARDGKTGKELWHVQLGEKSMGMYHGPSFGDLDGDGKLELAFAAYDGKVYCVRAKDADQLWAVQPGDRYFMSPTAIADVDGDKKPEVVAVSQCVTVIEPDGKVRYSKPAGAEGRSTLCCTRGPSIADLDGDGGLDIAYVMQDGLFCVVRGKDGKRLHELEPATFFEKKVMGNSHGPVLADVNGDGRLDAFYVVGYGNSRQPAKSYGMAVCVTGFKGKGPGWYMLRHDLENSGNVATPLPKLLRKHLR